VAAAGDFHSANRIGRLDLSPSRRTRRRTVAKASDDSVLLSDVANVSLLEEEGLSVPAIAANLGLTTDAVLTDIEIADEISHPHGDERHTRLGKVSN